MKIYFSAEAQSDERLNQLLKHVLNELGSSLEKSEYKPREFAVLDDARKIYCRMETHGFEEYLALCELLRDQGFETVRRSRRTKDYDEVWRFWPEGQDQV